MPERGDWNRFKGLSSKEKLLLAEGGKISPLNSICEKISLGNLKAQDWELVQRRSDLREMVPALYLLGQKIPSAGKASGGTVNLLQTSLQNFFLAAFQGSLSPLSKIRSISAFLQKMSSMGILFSCFSRRASGFGVFF